MKIKIEFEIKETGEYVVFESKEIEEKENMFGEFIYFENGVNSDEYVYVVGSMKIYKPKHNVICAEKVDLNWLNVEYKFN